MASMTMAEIIGTSLMGISTAVSAGTAAYSVHQQEKAMEKQEDAQRKADAKVAAADEKAEKERLEALAKNQEAQGFDFGVDSALAKRYADAAQKWGAGTGSMDTNEDDDNPFYTRGLV